MKAINIMSDNYIIRKDGKRGNLKRYENITFFYAKAPRFPSFHSENGADGWSPVTPYLSYGNKGRIGCQAHNSLFVFSIVTANQIYCYRIVNYSADHDSYCEKGGCDNE